MLWRGCGDACRGFSGQPLLARWTQGLQGQSRTIRGRSSSAVPARRSVSRKLMDDSGAVTAIAQFMTERLGTKRAVLAVVLAGAPPPPFFSSHMAGVSLFVAFLVCCRWRRRCSRQTTFPPADPAAIVFSAPPRSTWTGRFLAGHAHRSQNAIRCSSSTTTPFAAPEACVVAARSCSRSVVWWLSLRERMGALAGERLGGLPWPPSSRRKAMRSS